MTDVAVCVCTYRRLEQLGRTLDSLAKIRRPTATMFVIVDNDGTDARVAKRVDEFRRSSGARVEFAIEHRPGISAARNAAISIARSAGASAVAMLDDDEWASQDWLVKLLETRNATASHVVGGPVRPVLPPHRQNLAKYAWLWSVGKGYLDGQVYVSCTCNCLVDLSATTGFGEEPFPLEFGFTGGEDTVFFRRLHRAGVPMAWCDEAVVFEEVPDWRANFDWLRRRWYRQGIVGVACERIVPFRAGPSPLLKTMLLCVRFPFYPLFHRKALAHPVMWRLEFERLSGRIGAHLGRRFEEYEREETAAPSGQRDNGRHPSCAS